MNYRKQNVLIFRVCIRTWVCLAFWFFKFIAYCTESELVQIIHAHLGRTAVTLAVIDLVWFWSFSGLQIYSNFELPIGVLKKNLLVWRAAISTFCIFNSLRVKWTGLAMNSPNCCKYLALFTFMLCQKPELRNLAIQISRRRYFCWWNALIIQNFTIFTYDMNNLLQKWDKSMWCP